MRFFQHTPLATQSRAQRPEVEKRVEEAMPALLAELESNSSLAKVVIAPGASPDYRPSRVLELVFSMYDPKNIGIIDYHGSARNYSREQVGGINLNIESTEDRMRQHAIYNYTNKYANLKTQMASGYVRSLLEKQVTGKATTDTDLTDTLKELFATFFPGKDFLGPQPTEDGRMTFPVRTPSGFTHDIDELSTGEKEVLYGYLRLRNAAPRNSVILIDEPELHLNPRLIHGLAPFYHKHLGKALSNQLWLVTHSDTLLREAVGRQEFSVFHMQNPSDLEEGNQVTAVSGQQDVERIVIDLVGDLAAYRPGAKIVIFEGGGDSQFDVRMVASLFPVFQLRVNSISCGNKRRVADLYEVLEQARTEGHLPAQFYAITDRDGSEISSADTHRKQWDVYHIENYLLVATHILRVLKDLNAARAEISTEEEIERALKNCARSTVPMMVQHQIRVFANLTLVNALDLAIDPRRTDISAAFSEAIENSKKRVNTLSTDALSPENIAALEKKFMSDAESALEDDRWRRDLRGRDILRRFVGEYCGHVRVGYEVFRELLVARMRDDGYQPVGMKVVLEGILNDEWKRN